MQQLHYERLVGVIHRHRTWVGVAKYSNHMNFFVNVSGEMRQIRSRALVLYAREKHGVYPKGHSWNIPEYRLDKAVNALKQRDEKFRRRWKSATPNEADVQEIIRIASRGFLNLELKTREQLDIEARIADLPL